MGRRQGSPERLNGGVETSIFDVRCLFSKRHDLPLFEQCFHAFDLSQSRSSQLVLRRQVRTHHPNLSSGVSLT